MYNKIAISAKMSADEIADALYAFLVKGDISGYIEYAYEVYNKCGNDFMQEVQEVIANYLFEFVKNGRSSCQVIKNNNVVYDYMEAHGDEYPADFVETMMA